MSRSIPRRVYADLYGPTTRDRVRLADTDLVLEVEVSRSAINRLGIFAALGVKEVWRVRREGIQPLALSKTGEYEPIAESIALPKLSPQLVMEHLNMRKQRSTSDILRTFRSRCCI